MSEPVTAIVGVGPSNGAAFAKRFAEGGHRVALLSRSVPYLEELAKTIGGGAAAFQADASDPKSVAAAFAAIEEQMGPVNTLLYNAGSGVFGSVDDVEPADLELAWRINTLGLFAAARAVLPNMRKAKSGAIVVTGATASLRGGARFAAFAQAKAAQRSLAQSLARQVGADGIHVSLVIVDGIIDSDRTRAQMGEMPPGKALLPSDIAEAIWYLAHQPPSAWTFELDLRPSLEKW